MRASRRLTSRNATAYGHSPMLRIDLVVNNLLACAVATGEIRIMSDGSPWRPLIHCRDIARAFVAFMNAAQGANSQQGHQRRRQYRELSGARRWRSGQEADPARARSPTRAKSAPIRETIASSSTSLNTLLPDFKLQYNLAAGMEELHRKLVDHGFGKEDWDGDQFVRLRTLKDRLDLLKEVA